MMNAMNDVKTIRLDRMRYNKNLFSSRLCYLAILFNVLYFVVIYEINNTRLYEALMGASIVYNLVFLLLCFLASEGVKSYRIGYAWLLLALSAGQIIRIFILPLQAYTATVTISKVTYPVMQMPQFIYVVVMLILSAVCCLIAGIAGIKRSLTLKNYTASLSEKAA